MSQRDNKRSVPNWLLKTRTLQMQPHHTARRTSGKKEEQTEQKQRTRKNEMTAQPPLLQSSHPTVSSQYVQTVPRASSSFMNIDDHRSKLTLPPLPQLSSTTNINNPHAESSISEQKTEQQKATSVS